MTDKREIVAGPGPVSLSGIVSDKVHMQFEQAWLDREDLFGMDEKELYQKLRSENKQPTPTDNTLRIKFWFEYERAMSKNKPMVMENVFGGVCRADYFYSKFLEIPEKVVWLLQPPRPYAAVVEETLSYGLDRMREILSLPVVDPKTGKVNVKLGELQAKITAMMDMRKHGAPTQKISQESKSMHLNISTTAKEVGQAVLDGNMEDLEKELKKLRGQVQKGVTHQIAEDAVVVIKDDNGDENSN